MFGDEPVRPKTRKSEMKRGGEGGDGKQSFTFPQVLRLDIPYLHRRCSNRKRARFHLLHTCGDPKPRYCQDWESKFLYIATSLSGDC